MILRYPRWNITISLASVGRRETTQSSHQARAMLSRHPLFPTRVIRQTIEPTASRRNLKLHQVLSKTVSQAIPTSTLLTPPSLTQLIPGPKSGLNNFEQVRPKRPWILTTMATLALNATIARFAAGILYIRRRSPDTSEPRTNSAKSTGCARSRNAGRPATLSSERTISSDIARRDTPWWILESLDFD